MHRLDAIQVAASEARSRLPCAKSPPANNGEQAAGEGAEAAEGGTAVRTALGGARGNVDPGVDHGLLRWSGG